MYSVLADCTYNKPSLIIFFQNQKMCLKKCALQIVVLTQMNLVFSPLHTLMVKPTTHVRLTTAIQLIQHGVQQRLE